MNDVYNYPEKFGLELLGSIDDPNADWDFDIFALWRHKETGVVYYGSDSGCSCPSPFEYYHSLSDLNVLDDSPGSWETFEESVKDWCGYADRESPNEGQWAVLRTDMLRKAAAAL